MPSMVVEKCDRTGTKVLVKCEGRANQSVCLCVRPDPTRFHWLESRQRYDRIGSTTVSDLYQIQRNIRELDTVISAEMAPEDDDELRELVLQHMAHNPTESHNPAAV